MHFAELPGKLQSNNMYKSNQTTNSEVESHSWSVLKPTVSSTELRIEQTFNCKRLSAGEFAPTIKWPSKHAFSRMKRTKQNHKNMPPLNYSADLLTAK